MATILRHKRRRDFTVLPNGMLRDPRLSFRACGLLAYLLMLPGGEGADSVTLSERKHEGRDAIRSAFKELETAGYLARHREQDAHGFWSHVIEVTDEPTTPFQSSDDRRRVNRPSDSQSLSTTKNCVQMSDDAQDGDSVEALKDNSAEKGRKLSQEELAAQRAAKTGRRTRRVA